LSSFNLFKGKVSPSGSEGKEVARENVTSERISEKSKSARMTTSAVLLQLSRRRGVGVDFRSISSSSTLPLLFKYVKCRFKVTSSSSSSSFHRKQSQLSAVSPPFARNHESHHHHRRQPEAGETVGDDGDADKPIETIKSVYGMARKPEATPWAERLKTEEEKRSEMPLRRTFKSIYEVAEKDPDSAAWAGWFKAMQEDFFVMHPEEKINHLKHLQLQRMQANDEVIMRVTLRDVFLYMQPSRTIVCALAPVPFYYSAKWAVMLLSVPLVPATWVSISLTLFVFYKYLSSICTQIKQDPRNSTYSAFFPFRLPKQEVKFRKSHFQLISTKRDPFRTCHVLIKGKKAFCPKRCFTSSIHYDELVCSTAKMRGKKDA